MAAKKAQPAVTALMRAKFVDAVVGQLSRGEKLHGTNAALEAGYSAKSAHTYASTLLQDPEIFAQIDAERRKLAQAANINPERILVELARLGTADIAKAYDENGELLPIHEIPEDVRRAISGVESEELFEGVGKKRVQIGYVKKVKFYDKNTALRTLAQNFGMLVEKHEVTGKITLEDFITASRKGEE